MNFIHKVIVSPLGLFASAHSNRILENLIGHIARKRQSDPSLTPETEMNFINFSQQIVEPINKEFAEDIIDGSPQQKVWSHFVGNEGNFKSGMWDSTAGVFRGPMNDQIEFCHILEGEARIETPDGQSRIVKAGDAFVMDKGLQPVWHVEKYVRKYYVICSA